MKISVYNLGCKVNQYESDSLAFQLEQLGHIVVESLEFADAYIINTCAVTNEAERKSRQTITKCNKLNANAKIYVCGCASQNNANHFVGKPNVQYVIGIAGKANLIESFENTGVNVSPLPNVYEDDYTTRKIRTRAYVKIQDGCNNYCAYCLIPYLRGRSRSRSIDSIVSECEHLAESTREIVLTGIDISSYGLNIDTNLVELLCALSHINVRIRLGSLEVNVITPELLYATRQLRAFCPHFHLSLQSGSDKTLQAMNRHYTTAEYMSKVNMIREYYPLAGITTDLICAFPTETEEQFAETLAFVDKVKFSDMHIFAYSKRDGTEASKLGMLDKQISSARCAKASVIARRNKEVFENQFIGQECEVLVEDSGGYTREYVRVEVPNALADTVMTVTPIARDKDGLNA